MALPEYKAGMWLRNKQSGELFEIIYILPAWGHCGPDRCIMHRRIPYCTGNPHNVATNIIAQDFDIAPTAQILYSNTNIRGA